MEYDGNILFNSFYKIAKPTIDYAQKSIREYLKTVDKKISKAFDFGETDYNEYYNGYTLYQNKKMIGIAVLWCNMHIVDDYGHETDEEYENHLNEIYKCCNNIANLIKHAKKIFRISDVTGNNGDAEFPIEVCIRIDDLIKLDPSCYKTSNIDINKITKLLNKKLNKSKNFKYINKELEVILNKYNMQDHLYAYNFGAERIKSEIVVYVFYVKDIYYKLRNEELDTFIKECKDGLSKMRSEVIEFYKQYIPVKFKFDTSKEHIAVIKININDLYNNENAIKQLTESSIFEDIDFI